MLIEFYSSLKVLTKIRIFFVPIGIKYFFGTCKVKQCKTNRKHDDWRLEKCLLGSARIGITGSTVCRKRVCSFALFSFFFGLKEEKERSDFGVKYLNQTVDYAE